MKTTRDNKELCAAILTDLSKSFDCICHDLLIAKLNAYGFYLNALKLICDYLSDRSQSRFFVQCLFRHYLMGTTGIYTWTSAI